MSPMTKDQTAELMDLAERCKAYDPTQSPDNRADELELHRDIVMRTGIGSMNPAFEATFPRSLDTALTLVPTDPEIDGPMVWALDTNTFVGCVARIYTTDNDMGPDIQVEAATPALALCAAALKARASKGEQG